MKSWHRYYPLSIIVTAAVFYLSLFNPAESDLADIDLSDKIIHGIMYAGVTSVFWFEYLLNGQKLSFRNILIFLILCPIAMGGILELMQEHLTECRSGEWGDFAADAVGVLLAAAAGWFVLKPLVLNHRPATDDRDDG